jgi:hypothetical protein
MSLFDDDFAAADDLFAEVFGVTVDYWRSSSEIADITAEVITAEHDGSALETVNVISRPRAYLIKASLLVIGSATITPRQGDRIKETIGGTVHVFTVARINDRDAYEWADVNGGSWIVHCRLTGTE